MAPSEEPSSSADKDIPVRVAVRIRPLVTKEIREGCQESLRVSDCTPQVILKGTDKAFTFDYAFSVDAPQHKVYDDAVAKVVNQLFHGYNVTILAYGQTGSGKTYSMGTTYVSSRDDDLDMGIIPRAVNDIFNGVKERENYEFIVKVSFIELYKENLHDLLNTKSREESIVDIREDAKGGIKITGLTEIPVTSIDETMRCLEHGSLNRATAATAMNARSSRSHAIFSLSVEMRSKIDTDNLVCAKFHLVDLAGSERAKKTGATGERFKEGVNINKGLLALGNVISALGGEGQRAGHIPYRDSKLTRLLQDSLGGNSHTVMLACVSPADSNLEETLSTLRYADRARKIKNKPIVNRDPQAAELNKLRQQVQQLQVQLLSSQGGSTGFVTANAAEVDGLLDQNRFLQVENEKLTRALQIALEENTNMAEKALMAEMARDKLKLKLEELRTQTGNTVEVLNKTLDVSINPQYGEQINLVKDLQRKIIDLQTDQRKSEKAIVDHELSRHSVSTCNDEAPVVDNEGNQVETSPIKGDFGAAYTLRQAKLNEELQDLNRVLAMKEELMSKMSVNDTRFVAMKSTYEKNLKEFEDQITNLIKEKDLLNQQLRNASHNSSNKIAEQRRKRLQELEALITGMKKKILEQNKLIKMKEQSEQKVTKLNSEIQGMKGVRVKLIRQMKEDGEKFRKWKAQKDREVAQLKEADRKKQFQIVKMERLHSKQQNVLKRKMEEAVSINKRLKDALALQKSCQERRNASKDIGGVNGRIKSWLDGELEVISVKNQVKSSLVTLMDDRKTISEHLNKIKRQLTREELGQGMQDELIKKKTSLENELEMRTAQISDMQAKIVEEDTDILNKKRFDYVQSMIEAKCAMQYLFQVASDNVNSATSLEGDLKELGCQYEEVCQNLEEVESELKNLREIHQKELSKLSREHEDKILFLLRQMPKTKTEQESSMDGEGEDNVDEALLQRLKFQEEELQKMSHLHELLQQKTAECEVLASKLEQAEKNTSKVDPVIEGSPLFTAKTKLPVPTFAKPKKRTITERNLDSSFSDESDDEEEANNDPDWSKTPLYRRIKQITRRGHMREESHSTSDDDRKESVKRTSTGDIKCGCTKDCSSKLCKCKKNGNACGVACKCKSIMCVNKTTPNVSYASSAEAVNGDTFLNSTFDVSLKPPNTSSETRQSKRPRLPEKEDITKENIDSFEQLQLNGSQFVANSALPSL